MAAIRHLSALTTTPIAIFIIAITFALTVSAADNGTCSYDLADSHDNLVVADGWSYRLVANKLDRPRGILFDTEGALLVIDSGVGIVHLELEDSGGTCLQVKEKKTLVKNEDLNHGIALTKDGRTLYASTVNDVYSWSYDAADASVDTSSRQNVVTNMTNGGHSTRTLLLSREHPDYLLVSRGSEGNDDDAAIDLSSGHSQLRAFNITALRDTDSDDKEGKKAYDFLDGKLLGWGLRNSVGVAEHPSTGGIWSVENSVDNLRRHGEDIHQNNPGEELNFHGYLNGSKEDQGGNYGYPLCYTLWSTKNFPDLGDLKTGDQFPADQSDDGDLITIQDDDECNTKYVPPELAFQAHTAPLDIKFDENGTTAFVSFHGSWNRDDPVGYVVSSIAFEDGHPVNASDSMDAATPILSNPDNSKCPDDCFRPVGLAWDSEGRLWFSSDSTGEIFVLRQSGTNESRDAPSESGGDDDSAASQFFPPRPGAVLVTIAALVMGVFLA